MAFATATNQIATLQEKYDNPTNYMKDLVYAINPFLALIPKDESPEGFAGKYIPVPLVFAPPAGRSATFSYAQSNQQPVQDASFFVYRVSNYEVVSITNELLEATKNNAAAFVDAATLSMDTGFRNISNDLAGDLFKSGTGSRGQVGTITLSGANNSVTIVLVSLTQITQFEVGMTLVSSTGDGGAPSTDTVTVTGVNRSTGTLTGTSSTTLSNSLSGTWAINGYLYVQGDIASGGASGTSSYLKITGLGAWLPYGGPTSTPFWGVDRTADSVRMAGYSADYSDRTLEEGLIDLATNINLQGGKPDYCFVNFLTYSALLKELGARVQYVQVEHDEADISFEAIRLMTAYGPVAIVADRSCPAQLAYMLQLDTFKLRSLGRAPHVLTYGMEGLQGIRIGNADALEVRIGYYGNMICSAPGWSGVAKLSA